MQRSLNGFLPNGTILNNVAYFNGSTNPTQRLNGALQIGDRNYRTDLNVDTFWNGTYWVGIEQKLSINSAGFNWTATNASANTFVTRSQAILPTNLFCTKIYSKVTSLGSVNSTNNYSFQVVILDPTASTASGSQLDVLDLFAISGTQAGVFTATKTTQLNTAISTAYESSLAIRITKTGNPGNCAGFFELTWRNIYA